jgi:hypothetical protein
VTGNHHDLYRTEKSLDELFTTLAMAGISLDGLFINADSGFDSQEFLNICSKHGIITNMDFNPRNGEAYENRLLETMPCNTKDAILP